MLLNGNGWLRAISLGDAIETEDRTKRAALSLYGVHIPAMGGRIHFRCRVPTRGKRQTWGTSACLFDPAAPSQAKLRTIDRLMCPSTQTRFGKAVMMPIRLGEDAYFLYWVGAIICCGFGKHSPLPD